jgi:hypothetical protein
MINSLPEKLQDDIIVRATSLRVANRLPLEITEDILDMISGAIELMELDASDSDRYRPPILTREQLKILIELSGRHVDYDEYLSSMEKLSTEADKLAPEIRPTKKVIN